MAERSNPAHETPAAYVLADECENVARQAMAARDFQNAQMQSERAVVLRQRLGDRAALLRVLRSLGEAYQARNRWHRVLDTLDWIFSTFQQDPPDYAGMAGTLAEIGTTMITVGRRDSAAYYLKYSVTAYDNLAEPAPIGHAEALVSWGNLLWSQGAYGKARRKFHAALALLVDVDNTMAEQVRDLLRRPTQSPSHLTRDELDAERKPYGRHTAAELPVHDEPPEG